MNPRLRFSLVLAACLLASATPLLSAEAPLEKITLTVNVVAGGKPPTVSPPPGPIVVKGTTVPLEIRCDGVDCNKVSVKFSDQQITLTVAQDTKSAAAQLALKSAAGGSLSLAFDSQPIFEAQVTQGGDAKKPVVISKLCQDDSGKDVKWIGLLCILFWLGMVIVRWHRIARPSRELLRAQITSLRAEMATTPVANHNKADLAEIAKLLDAASALIGRSKWFSGFGVIDFLFWSRGQEIAGWGYVHDVERQITPFLSEATVRVRLEAVEQRLRLTTDAPCLALADAIHKALGEQPADGLRLRALLDQGLSTVYGREDNSYASLVSWQNKTSWLVGCGLVLILVLAAVTQHHAILLLVGGVGGLLSRLSRSLDRKDVPTDYGASWTTLFLSPVAGALGAWAGLLVTGLAKDLSILGTAFTANLANPCEASTLGIALVFGFSERLLDSVLDKIVAKGAGDPSGATNPPPAPKPPDDPLTIPDPKLPDAAVGVAYAATLKATGAMGNVKWSLAQGGGLPAGLHLNADGSITGTPTAVGTSTFTVQVADQKSTASRQLTLTVK